MMTPEKKIRSLFFVIAFLFITNILLLLFLVLNRNIENNRHKHDTRSVIEFFLQDEIGFDNKQMAVYKKMRDVDFEKRTPIFDSLKYVKNKFYENIYIDSMSDSATNELAVVVSKKQMEVDMHMLQYFKNVRKICTANQLPKFDSSFKKIVERITAVRYRSKKRIEK